MGSENNVTSVSGVDRDLIRCVADLSVDKQMLLKGILIGMGIEGISPKADKKLDSRDDADNE